MLIALDGEVFDPVLVGDDVRGCLTDDGACCGCGEPKGLPHDGGCDWEPCPRCGGQMMACDCRDDEMPRFTVDEAREMIFRLIPVAFGLAS